MTAAYHNCNRSSMGAAALTTSGFPIDRNRVKELLAFEELVENSYDAIGGADYLGETATAIKLAAINLGRVVQDLLLWCTQEFAAIKVASPYVQISSIMPQKRNPVSLEHMRSLLSSCVGNADSVLAMMHNTPFGDIVDTEDDMQPYAWRSLELMDKMYRLLSVVVGTMEVNKEVLRKRTESSFATVTELADTLVRTDKLSFRTSHHIVSTVVKRAMAEGIAANQITWEFVNDVARECIGRNLSMDINSFKQSLDPDNFIQVRTLPGGPSPQEMDRMIQLRHHEQLGLEQWLTESGHKSRTALENLDEVMREWGNP
ncbi:Argininosuccinate lyase [compost metagenome]